MLHWAIIFFVIALVAGLLGMNGVAGLSADLGKTLITVFIILVIVGLFFGRGMF